ncbi:M48 family metallopeptidase [bacterium]|nr:M48 family metallopeptidase [bacterium]
MWEAIASNRRRSFMLISLMGVLLVLLGFIIGAASAPNAGPMGALVALGVWFVMWIVALASGDSILLGAAGAQKVEHADAPQLFNVVEEMKIAAGLPAMPDVYIIDDPAPNAFAVGRTPEKCAVAVTSGLIKRLGRDELQGVIAHEVGHIVNRDTRFMTQAAVMLGAIVMISDIFLRATYWGGGSRRRDDRDNQAAQIMMLIAIVMAILAPLAARLLWLACSRRREYLADATSARLTRYPQGLAAALEKISGSQAEGSGLAANRALAPLYIANPLRVSGLFSTHPPIEERIQILRTMSGGAGFAEYQAACERVHGKGVIGGDTLKQAEAVALRAPSAEDEPRVRADAGIARTREALGVLDRGAGLLTIACACGMTLKVRPDDPRTMIACPRCGRVHQIN